MINEIYFDKLVIGSSLEALLFSFYGKHKTIFARSLMPSFLEEIEDFGLGTSKYNIWNKIAFQLSLAGYFPFGNKIKHIVYQENNTVKVVSNEEKIYYIKYKQLYIFDDYNIYDLPPSLSTTSDEIRISDWFYVDKGDVQNYDLLKNDSKFINEVIFFKNPQKRRVKRKDICVISYCKKSELEKYPEYLVKIKLEGSLDGIKLNHIHRDIYEYGQNIYENFDGVQFVYDDAKFIFDINQRRHKIDYMKYLRLKLGI